MLLYVLEDEMRFPFLADFAISSSRAYSHVTNRFSMLFHKRSSVTCHQKKKRFKERAPLKESREKKHKSHPQQGFFIQF